MWKKLIMTSVVVAATGAAQAATQTEGFETLSGLNATGNNSGAIANQDPGLFDWSTDNINNLQLVTLARALSNKNLTGITSAANAAVLGNWVGYLNGATALTFVAKASAGFTAFDLDSINFYTRSANTTITFTGLTTTGQTVTDTFTMAAANTLYTYTDSLNKFTGVTSLSFSGNQVAFDNVSVTPLETVISAVPEASRLTMLLAGLAMMGFIARRRSI